MSARQYVVRFTARAQQMLAEVKDRRVQQVLVDRVEKLAVEPGKQGKALADELHGYRSVRAAGQRYRIIYVVRDAEVTVVVVLIGRRSQGSRKDAYELARKLARLGLLEAPEGESS